VDISTFQKQTGECFVQSILASEIVEFSSMPINRALAGLVLIAATFVPSQAPKAADGTLTATISDAGGAKPQKCVFRRGA
jgi:hypothetical protein